MSTEDHERFRIAAEAYHEAIRRLLKAWKPSFPESRILNDSFAELQRIYDMVEGKK
jgi:hypothetical protein